MEFFLLWIMTRIEERGWPRTRGLLRRRKFITHDVVLAATEDAVRVAITIGGSLPDIARAIAITYVGEAQAVTRGDVDHWIDSASDRGDEKMNALSQTYPQWLRLCSIGTSKGDTVEHLLLSPAGYEYDMGSTDANEMIKVAVALAGIAMCWALRHPDKAEDLFYDANAVVLSAPEPYSVSARETYSVWLHMAEMLVSRYSEAVGFQRYEDLP
jgi:hypothetical protein